MSPGSAAAQLQGLEEGLSSLGISELISTVGGLKSNPHQGSADQAMCGGGLVIGMSAVVIVLKIGVGILLTLSLEKRPLPPQELPRTTCLVMYWELGWVRDGQGA